jgi:hypothetical protein
LAQPISAAHLPSRDLSRLLYDVGGFVDAVARPGGRS